MTRVQIDREAWTLRIEYDAGRVSLARIQAAIDAAAEAADTH